MVKVVLASLQNVSYMVVDYTPRGGVLRQIFASQVQHAKYKLDPIGSKVLQKCGDKKI